MRKQTIFEKLEIEFNLLKKNIESKSSFNTKCREFEKMLEDLGYFNNEKEIETINM